MLFKLHKPHPIQILKTSNKPCTKVNFFIVQGSNYFFGSYLLHTLNSKLNFNE